MGTLGTSIYSDDHALDIKGLYKDLHKFGITGEKAVEIIWSELGSPIGDDILSDTVFWLTLLDLFWKDGNLPNRVRENALEIIESGLDLENWDFNSSDYKKRLKVLDLLKEQLNSPSPKIKKMPDEFIEKCGWEVNEIIAYPWLNNHYFIFRVLDFSTKFGGRSPILELIDYKNKGLPDKNEIMNLPLAINTNITIPGSNHANKIEECVKDWKIKGLISEKATIEDYYSMYKTPAFAIYQQGAKDKSTSKIVRLNFSIPSSRYVVKHLAYQQLWSTWKRIGDMISHYYGYDYYSKC